MRQLLAYIGGRIFPYRLPIGLLPVLGAAFIIRPANVFGCYEATGVSSCILMVATGLGLRAWAAACAGDHTREKTIQAPALVTGGPYAYLRNPIYCGSIILGLGMVGLLGDPRMLFLLIAAFTILYFAIIPAEEHFLERSFGESYLRYRTAVPVIIPRWRPWPDARPRPARWSLARGEAALALLLAIIYLALRGAARLRGI